MYVFLLWLHSVTRWLVVIGGLAAIITAIWGLVAKREWDGIDKSTGVFFTSVFGIQVIVGLILYFISPWGVRGLGLLTNEDARVQAIFFSVYHIAMMLIALVVAQLGYSRAKRAESGPKAFRTALLGYGIGFLLVFLAIPWGIRPNWPTVGPF